MPSLFDANSGEVLFDNLVIADKFWSRAVGLLGRRELALSEAILIRPCSSIHTFFMRMRINVAFIDANGVVLSVHRDVPPWRIRFGERNSAFAIEYNASLERLNPSMVVKTV